MERAVVIAGAPESGWAAQLLAPLCGAVAGEAVRAAGGHAMLVLDELAQHAQACNALSPLLYQAGLGGSAAAVQAALLDRCGAAAFVHTHHKSTPYSPTTPGAATPTPSSPPPPPPLISDQSSAAAAGDAGLSPPPAATASVGQSIKAVSVSGGGSLAALALARVSATPTSGTGGAGMSDVGCEAVSALAAVADDLIALQPATVRGTSAVYPPLDVLSLPHRFPSPVHERPLWPLIRKLRSMLVAGGMRCSELAMAAELGFRPEGDDVELLRYRAKVRALFSQPRPWHQLMESELLQAPATTSAAAGAGAGPTTTSMAMTRPIAVSRVDLLLLLTAAVEGYLDAAGDATRGVEKFETQLLLFFEQQRPELRARLEGVFAQQPPKPLSAALEKEISKALAEFCTSFRPEYLRATFVEDTLL